jgi:autotransporter translocation and assembly factor TamB
MAMMNIPNLVTIKLDGTHFILWELQLPLVRSQQLLGFLDGTTAAPEKWIECSTSTDGSVKVSKRI